VSDDDAEELVHLLICFRIYRDVFDVPHVDNPPNKWGDIPKLLNVFRLRVAQNDVGDVSDERGCENAVTMDGVRERMLR
jgi:hypothetical protein